MDFLIKVTTFIQKLSKKEFLHYLFIILASVTIIIGALTHYIYNTSSNLISQIKRLELTTNKTVRILKKYEKIQDEEKRFEALLKKHKDFNIKIFFEQFCKEQNIYPEQGWDTSSESINPKFEEISLPATFKNQTTEKLVKILEEIDKKEIVYIKELSLRTEKEKKITFSITIATKRSK